MTRASAALLPRSNLAPTRRDGSCDATPRFFTPLRMTPKHGGRPSWSPLRVGNEGDGLAPILHLLRARGTRFFATLRMTYYQPPISPGPGGFFNIWGTPHSTGSGQAPIPPAEGEATSPLQGTMPCAPTHCPVHGSTALRQAQDRAHHERVGSGGSRTAPTVMGHLDSRVRGNDI